MDSGRGFRGGVVETRQGSRPLGFWQAGSNEELIGADGERLSQPRNQCRVELRPGVQQHTAVDRQGERRRVGAFFGHIVFLCETFCEVRARQFTGQSPCFASRDEKVSRLERLSAAQPMRQSRVFTKQIATSRRPIGDRARLGYPARVSSASLPKVGGAAGIALTAMQVDVTTRLGAHSPATATGFASLDGMLSGGLRSGTVLAIAGAPGVGRTAFALLMAYMAARAKAGVVFASASLDATEVMARLAARALHREYPDARTPYGMIWSGQAWQDAATHRAVADSVETVVKKVGAQLHLYRASGLESTSSLAECAAHQWSRHERAVLVVDDIEAFSSTGDGSIAHAAAANGSMEGRVTSVAYDLRRIADQGCAVILTTLSRHAELVAPAVTLAGELREAPGAPRENDARSMLFSVYKNRIGETGAVPLRFVPGAGSFEEQAPRA